MTKNGDFGQNRQNRSTSNACRIARTHNAFRLFFCLKHTYIKCEQKTFHMEGFFLAGDLSLKKFPNDHGEMVTKLGLNHEIFFISKSYGEIISHHFGPFPDK